jgi:site-specific DNA-adenine methylase
MPSQTKIPTFPWDGGKSKLAPDILKFAPRRGQKFIDLFAGRGNIVLRAIHDGLDYENWVVNDILTAPFFRALRDYGDKFVAEDCTKDLFATRVRPLREVGEAG